MKTRSVGMQMFINVLSGLLIPFQIVFAFPSFIEKEVDHYSTRNSKEDDIASYSLLFLFQALIIPAFVLMFFMSGDKLWCIVSSNYVLQVSLAIFLVSNLFSAFYEIFMMTRANMERKLNPVVADKGGSSKGSGGYRIVADLDVEIG